jgi:hypothetical protein
VSFRTALCALLLGRLSLACAGARPPHSAADAGDSPAASQKETRGESSAERANGGPDTNVFLSAIPIRASERARGLVVKSASDDDWARGLRVRVEIMAAYKDLGELSRRAKLPVVNGTFQISDLSTLGSRDRPTKRDQASSFVIDFEEASFKAPVAELEQSGRTGSPEAIATFAEAYISEKTYAHSFDIASRVATSRAGDCTEHAVFTTALLRRFGFKARVVFGIVLVGLVDAGSEGQILAFGHAWVERYADGRWQIVDTALGRPASASGGGRATVSSGPAGGDLRLVYLPINVMKDETASYARALMDQVGVESVVGLEVDASGRAK